MKAQQLKKSEYLNRLNWLKQNGRTYETQTTSNSECFVYNKRKFFLEKPNQKPEDKLTRRDLLNLYWFKKTTKKRLTEKPELITSQYSPNNIKYLGVNFSTRTNTDTTQKRILEIDMSSAYLEIAKNHNLISDKYYNLWKGSRKSLRLMALGSLATKKLIATYGQPDKTQNRKCKRTGLEIGCHYEGKESLLLSNHTEQDKETAQVFYFCAWKMGEIMNKILNEVEGVFFYWTDALFCEVSAKDEVLKRIHDAGMAATIEVHSQLKKRSNCITVGTGKKRKVYHFNKMNTREGAEVRRKIEAVERITKNHLRAVANLVGGKKNVFFESEQLIFAENLTQFFSCGLEDVDNRIILKSMKKHGLNWSDYLSIEKRYSELHEGIITTQDEKPIYFDFVRKCCVLLDNVEGYKQDTEEIKNYGTVTKSTDFYIFPK